LIEPVVAGNSEMIATNNIKTFKYMELAFSNLKI